MIIQFMKGSSSGESEVCRRLAPFLTIVKAGREGFIQKGKIDPMDLKIAQEGFLLAKKRLKLESMTSSFSTRSMWLSILT